MVLVGLTDKIKHPKVVLAFLGTLGRSRTRAEELPSCPNQIVIFGLL